MGLTQDTKFLKKNINYNNFRNCKLLIINKIKTLYFCISEVAFPFGTAQYIIAQYII